jgi:hypothetical protein
MSNRIRYTLNEVQRNTFYQMPKFLFSNEFKSMSSDAKVLYSLLRDRHDLSIKNQWINEKGEVFLIFSREEMVELMGVSESTILRIMNTLKKFNLIEEERQGLGKPNKIFLLALKNLEYSKTRQIEGSRPVNINSLDPSYLGANDTDINNTEIIQTISPILSVLEKPQKEKTEGRGEEGMHTQEVMYYDISKQLGEQKNEQKKESVQNTADQSSMRSVKPSSRYEFNTVLEKIKENIDWDELTSDNRDTELLDEICHVITATICTDFKEGWVSMGQERANAETVRSVFFKLTKDDIDYFFDCFSQQTEPIVKMAAYIRTSLFRNHGTISHHYSNRVAVDMPQFATPKINKKRE